MSKLVEIFIFSSYWLSLILIKLKKLLYKINVYKDFRSFLLITTNPITNLKDLLVYIFMNSILLIIKTHIFFVYPGDKNNSAVKLSNCFS